MLVSAPVADLVFGNRQPPLGHLSNPSIFP